VQIRLFLFTAWIVIFSLEQAAAADKSAAAEPLGEGAWCATCIDLAIGAKYTSNINKRGQLFTTDTKFFPFSLCTFFRKICFWWESPCIFAEG